MRALVDLDSLMERASMPSVQREDPRGTQCTTDPSPPVGYRVRPIRDECGQLVEYLLLPIVCEGAN